MKSVVFAKKENGKLKVSKNGLVKLYIKIVCNNSKSFILSGMEVDPLFYSNGLVQERATLKGKLVYNSPHQKQNKYLWRLQKEIYRAYANLIQKTSHKSIKATEIKSYYLNHVDQWNEENRICLGISMIEVIDNYIEYKKGNKNESNVANMKLYVTAYLDSPNHDYLHQEFSSVDRQIVRAFYYWMIDNSGLSQSTISNYATRFRFALMYGIVGMNQMCKTKMIEKPPKAIYKQAPLFLYESEYQKAINFKTESKTLNKIIKTLIVHCNLACRFSDMRAITPQQFEIIPPETSGYEYNTLVFKTHAQKTGKIHQIYIDDELACSILEDWNFAFAKNGLTSAKFNENIKKLLDAAEIHRLLKKTEYPARFVDMEGLRVCDVYTSHQNISTFIHRALTVKKLDLSTVSSITGRDIKTLVSLYASMGENDTLMSMFKARQ
jgi:hypothetical protein